MPTWMRLLAACPVKGADTRVVFFLHRTLEAIMSKWMVDAKGNGGDAGAEATKKVAQSDMGHDDFREFVAAHGGLAASVQAWIEECGYHVTDRGGGGGSWHVGVPFDDLETAFPYLANMTAKFSAAIGAGLLRFELKTWSRKDWVQS
jgi:hypothetical protein